MTPVVTFGKGWAVITCCRTHKAVPVGIVQCNYCKVEVDLDKIKAEAKVSVVKCEGCKQPVVEKKAIRYETADGPFICSTECGNKLRELEQAA